MVGQHQPDTVAKRTEPQRPMMGPRTSLHSDQARLMPLEEGQHLRTRQLAADDGTSLVVEAVNVKHAVGRIKAHGCRLVRL